MPRPDLEPKSLFRGLITDIEAHGHGVKPRDTRRQLRKAMDVVKASNYQLTTHFRGRDEEDRRSPATKSAEIAVRVGQVIIWGAKTRRERRAAIRKTATSEYYLKEAQTPPKR